MNFIKYSIYNKLLLIVLLTFISLKISHLIAQNIPNSKIPIVYLTGFDCQPNSSTNCSDVEEEAKKRAIIKIVDNQDGSVNNFNGPFTLESNIEIKFRGDPTSVKRSYRLETQDTQGNNSNVGLFGFPKENDWIFYGPYLDKSLIRNALVYDLVREMGWYAPRAKFFTLVKDSADYDFYINPGELTTVVKPVYEGVYVLLEKIKRDDDRVDIAELGPEEIVLPQPGDNKDKTGGYIVRIEDEFVTPGLTGWSSSKGGWNYLFDYPEYEDSGEGIQVPQIDYITEVFDAFESTMDSPTFNNPATGYPAHINVASFIDFIIVQEFTKNVDGYRKSSYFHKNKNSSGDSLIYAGPVWDFNISMGNTNEFDGTATTGFQYNFNNQFDDQFQVPFYWSKLMSDPEFASQLQCRYTQLRGTVLSDVNVIGKIDSLYNMLQQAADLNYQKWEILNTPIPAGAPNGFDNYLEAVEALKTWLQNRFTFLDEQWLGDYFDVKASTSDAICPGDEVILSVIAEGTVSGLYDWAIGDSIIASQIGSSFEIENADPTITYIVTGYNQSCADTARVKVNVPGFSLASGGGNKSICPGEIDTLEARGAKSYEWSPSYGFVNEDDIFEARPRVSPQVDTIYQVILTTNDGCEIIDSVKVNVKRAIPLTVNDDVTTCEGTGVQLNAMPDSLSAFSWVANPLDASLDDIESKTADPFVQPSINTAYTVTATGDNNCTTMATINVDVLTDTNINFGSYNACIGETIQLDCPGISNIENVLWQPSTGLSNNGILCPEIIVQQITEYTVKAETTDGCIFEGTLQINGSQGNAVNAGNDRTICAGEIVQLNATGGSDYQWEGSDAFSNPNTANPTIILNETTTLKVKSSGAGTCESEDEITITVTPNPLSVTEKEIIKCENDNAVQLEAFGADSYNWNPSSGLDDNTISNPLANPNETTTYTVFTIDGDCVFTDSIIVLVRTNEVYAIGETLTLCNGSNGSLSASGGVSYNWQPVTALNDPTIANPTVDVSKLTDDIIYEVTITDTNGCSGTLSQSVNLKSNHNVNVIKEATICSGGQTDLSATGGTTYLWEVISGDFSSIIANANGANPTVSPTSETEYQVNITDADGCSFIETVTVKIANNIVANAGEDRAICAGEKIELSAAGGTQYIWTNTTTLETFNGQEFSTTPNQTTTYVVTVSDGSCQGTDDITITVNPLPQPTVTGPSSICENQTVELSVNEHQTYNWTNNENIDLPNTSTISVSPSSTTIYTIEVSNENGCVEIANFELAVNPSPEITINEIAPICAGTETQLFATVNDDLAYLSWSTEQEPNFSNVIDPIVSSSETVQFILEAENGGCRSTASVLLVVHPLPEIEINANPIGDCNSSQIQLNATGGTVYTWQEAEGLSNRNIANPIATISTTTTFNVNVENENGCLSTKSIELKPGAGLVTSVSDNQSICRGESANLTASGGDIYDWFPSGSLSDPGSANTTATPLSTTEYTVTITDAASNCNETKKVTVTVNDPPSAEAGASIQRICEGEDLELQLQATPGSSIEWLPATGLSNNTIANPIVSINENRQYSVTVIATNGCKATDEVNIEIKPKPTAFAGNDTTLCEAQAIDLKAITNSENVEFSWMPSNIVSNPFEATTTANVSNNTTIVLTVTSENNCSTTDSVQINLGTKTKATVNDELRICAGGSASLSASGGTNYLWSPASFLNNPKLANPIANLGTEEEVIFTVIVSDDVGCSDSEQVKVTTANEVEPDAGENVTICLGESVQLFAAGGTTYMWTASTGENNIISNPNIYNPRVSPNSTTTFTVTVNDGTTCFGNDDVTVEVVEELPVSINPGDTEIFPNEIINLTATGADSYEWFTEDTSISCTNCDNPVVSPSTNTQYIVKGKSDNCVGYDTIMVNIKTCNLQTNITEDVILCGGINSVQLDFSSSNNYNYQWLSDNINSLSCTNCANPVATPNETTTYEVIISDAFCETTKTVTVTVLDGAIFFTENEVELCNNEILKYSIADLVNYDLQPQNGFTISNDSLIINPTINRIYTLTGELSDGCSIVEQLDVTVKIAPEINLGLDQFLCVGKSVTLNENSGLENASANWFPTTGLNNANILSPVAQPGETTSYTIRLEENGCVATDEIVINVIPNNFASVSKNVSICKGGQAQLSATGGINYTWSPAGSLNNSSINTPVASPTASTVYEVAIEDKNGCIDKEKVEVNVGSKLNVKLKDEFTICKDGNGVKLNAEGAFIYAWQPTTGLSAVNIANPVANPSNTTTYTLTASDGACTATETVTVNVEDQSLTAYAGEDVTICAGDTIQLKASGGIGYVWTNPESLSNHTINNPLAAPTETTTYTVTTANIYSCTDFDEVTVFVKEGDKELSVSPPQKICQGEDAQLTINYIQGYEYKWLPASSLNNPNIYNPIATPETATVYEVEVTNLEACKFTYTVVVDVVNLDAVSAGDDLIICKDETIELNATGSESYMWNTDATLNNLNIPNPLASPLNSNNYVVQLQRNGCSKIDTVFVEVADLTTFTESEKITVCEGSSITLSAAGGDRYNWSSTNFDFAQPQLQHQTLTPTQNSSNYTVEIGKANCVAQKQIEVVLGPAASYNLNPVYEVCKNGTVQLSLEGDGLSNISWLPIEGLNNVNIQQPEVTVIETVNYTSTFTTNSGCVAQASTKIEIIDELNITTNNTSFRICEGAIQTITANSSTEDVKYEWTLDGVYFASGNEIVVKPNITSVYTVTANLNDCSASKEVTVNVTKFNEDAGSEENFEVCFGDEAQLNAKGGETYSWSPAEFLSNEFVANPVTINITEPTWFSVDVNLSGCVLKDSLLVSPKECLVEFIPNSFSPNNDGVNDTWFIPEITRFSENELYIYNRWGQLVYSSVNYQNDWQGTFNGTPLPEATYYYILKVREESESLSGTVTILR